MEKSRDGANNHTVNKALCYYRQYRAKEGSKPHQDSADRIETRARQAMQSGNWKPLSDSLANLW